jgi:hypothetical protein
MANQIKKKYLVPEIFTEIDTDIANAVAAEETRAEGQEAAIRSEFAAADTALHTTISAEIAAADTALHTTISAEIDGDVEVEKLRAEAAEAALGVRIDNVLENLDSAAIDSFTEVVTAFVDADSNLETSITNLSTAAAADRALIRSEFAAADTALKGDASADYDTLGKLEDKIQENATSISNEVSNREAADDALQTTIDAIQGLDDILFEDSGVNSSGNATVDPEGRDGWYYKNAGSGEKAFWYFFSSVDGEGNVVNPVTVEEFQGVYSVNSVKAGPEGDTFHMALYTTPEGDGNDANWYRSRRVYVPSEPFDREVKMLFYVGQEPDAFVHPELPRMQMVESVVAGQQAGAFANSESMLYVAFSTNSVSQAGSIELLVNALGFNSSVYNKEYSLQIRDNFSLSGIKDSVLSNQFQIEQNTAAIAALDGNFATDQELEDAVSSLQAKIDADVLVEKLRAEGQEAAIRSEFADADTELQVKIDAEKARIDAILDASEADKDSFAEIVSLINSVDTESDNVFSAYVLSNDAALAQEISDREAGDAAITAAVTEAFGSLKDDNSGLYDSSGRGDLHTEFSALENAIAVERDRIDALDTGFVTEAEFALETAKIATLKTEMDAAEGRLTAIEGLAFHKESAVVAASNDFELLNEPKANSLSVFVGRLALIEGVDYDVVGKIVTMFGDLAPVGGVEGEKMEAGENIYFQYYK